MTCQHCDFAVLKVRKFKELASMARKKPAQHWRRLEELEPGLRLAVKSVGSITNLARLLGLTTQAISQWEEIPMQRVLEVEHITKVDRERLRPDLFRRRKRAS
jgi:Putative antitoxin of bacterial toxin-antitoxin system, YdaS/YdaT